MDTILGYLQAGFPACATFGPLFLIMDGRSPKATRLARYLGAIMIGSALILVSFVSQSQKHRISILEQRLDSLEQRLRAQQ